MANAFHCNSSLIQTLSLISYIESMTIIYFLFSYLLHFNKFPINSPFPPDFLLPRFPYFIFTAIYTETTYNTTQCLFHCHCHQHHRNISTFQHQQQHEDVCSSIVQSPANNKQYPSQLERKWNEKSFLLYYMIL